MPRSVAPTAGNYMRPQAGYVRPPSSLADTMPAHLTGGMGAPDPVYGYSAGGGLTPEQVMYHQQMAAHHQAQHQRKQRLLQHGGGQHQHQQLVQQTGGVVRSMYQAVPTASLLPGSTVTGESTRPRT